MEPTTLLAMAQAVRLLIDGIGQEIAIGKAAGNYTPEMIADIKTRAGISDAAFDSAVDAARARLANNP